MILKVEMFEMEVLKVKEWVILMVIEIDRM